MSIDFSYLVGSVAFFILAVLLIFGWKIHKVGIYLIFAVSFHSIWALCLSLLSIEGEGNVYLAEIWALEITKYLFWYLFLLCILNMSKLVPKIMLFGLFASGIFAIVANLMVVLGEHGIIFSVIFYLEELINILMPVIALLIIEQIYRNLHPDKRWGMKYLFLGLGSLFIYDFYLYADALLLHNINRDLWQARGIINALSVPLIAISVARNRDWSIDIFVSRTVVFHSTTLLASGIYLLLMSMAGYYIKFYGGDWGNFFQTIFLFGAIVLLFVLLFSGEIRSRFKLFLNRHFFNYHYDYRQEWLKLMTSLSATDSERPLTERSIKVLADLVDSPGGILWLKQANQSSYVFKAAWNMAEPPFYQIDIDSFLQQLAQQTVIDLNKVESAVIPDYFQKMPQARYIIPLFIAKEVYGMVILISSRSNLQLNWEHIDLLLTVAKQTASYLALSDTLEALSVAKQFEGVHKVSAFVVHDLKNLTAQLSLIVSNAQRHADNPAFFKDAMTTIDHAVRKMKALMEHLQSEKIEGIEHNIELDRLLAQVVQERSIQLPKPSFHIESECLPVTIQADQERFSIILNHLIQNAQDACDKDQKVDIYLRTTQNQAIISIQDQGCGMNKTFIQQRLFRPFDSTKGLTGMGIGAYESREFIQSLGGHINVTSQLGEGSTFTIILPYQAI